MRKWMIRACAVLALALGMTISAAHAQTPVAPCVTIAGTYGLSCQPVTPTNPLPTVAAPNPGTIIGLVGSIPVTYTDAATLSIATGGTSQQAFAANTTRKGLVIQNPCSATEDLFVNFGAAASATTIDLRACGSYGPDPGAITNQSVNVFAATTGHAFLAKEAN